MFQNTIWAGILQSGHELWVSLDATLSVFIEPVFVANFYWLAIIAPLSLALGIATFFANRRSLRLIRSNAEADQGSDPGVTEFGRPALILAAFLVLFVAATPPISVLVPTTRAWGFLFTALYFDVVSAALMFYFVAIIRDLVAKRRTAGRRTLAAYLLATLGMPLLASVGYILAYVVAAMTGQGAA